MKNTITGPGRGIELSAFAIMVNTVSLVATGCAGASMAPPSAAVVNLGSQELYAELMAEPEGARLKAEAAIGGLSIDAFYAFLKASATDAPAQVDGVLYGNAKQNLQSDRGAFAFLAQHFKTVGALWAALKFRPSAVTYQSFKTSLDQQVAKSHDKALDLVAYTYENTDECQQFTAGINIASEIAAGLGSRVADALTEGSNARNVRTPIAMTNGAVRADDVRQADGTYRPRGMIYIPYAHRYTTPTLRPIVPGDEQRLRGTSTIPGSSDWLRSCFLGADEDPANPKPQTSSLDDLLNSCAQDLSDRAWDLFVGGAAVTLAAAEMQVARQCNN